MTDKPSALSVHAAFDVSAALLEMEPALFCFRLAGAFARGMFGNHFFLRMHLVGRKRIGLRVSLRCDDGGRDKDQRERYNA